MVFEILKLTKCVVNIWSHLIGAALFAALPVYLYKAEIPPRYAVASKEDMVVCGIYFVGVTTCFCLSALSVMSLMVHENDKIL